jgi:hypothetical protein
MSKRQWHDGTISLKAKSFQEYADSKAGTKKKGLLY